MSLEVFDSFTSIGTLPQQRDSSKSPSSTINNFSLFKQDRPAIEERPDEFPEIHVDDENYSSLFGRDISEEDIENMRKKPKIKVLTTEEADKIILKDKLHKMTDAERDAEERFGMI